MCTKKKKRKKERKDKKRKGMFQRQEIPEGVLKKHLVLQMYRTLDGSQEVKGREEVHGDHNENKVS